jgi:serine protease Do
VPGGPADTCGLRDGDRLTAVESQPAARSIDWYRQLLDRRPGHTLHVSIERDGTQEEVSLVLAAPVATGDQMAWRDLGLELAPVAPETMRNLHPNYQRGLRVESVRPGTEAEAQGIRPGDIVVAMNGWKTESIENVAYVLQEDKVRGGQWFKFYILRDGKPLWGQLRVAASPGS